MKKPRKRTIFILFCMLLAIAINVQIGLSYYASGRYDMAFFSFIIVILWLIIGWREYKKG